MKKIPSKRFSSRRGFTMIEILIVVSLIVLLLAMSFKADLGRGDLNGAVRLSVSLVERTRTLAMQNPRQDNPALPSALLLIHNDDREADEDIRKNINRDGGFRYMRYIMVVVWHENPDTGEKGWKIVDRGYYLPEGVFFIDRGSSDGVKRFSSFGKSPPMDNIRLDSTSSRLQTGGSGERWLVYSFKGTGESQNVSGRFLLGNGMYIPTNKRIQYPNEFDIGGFLIFPWTVRVYENPDQISNN